MSHTFFFLFILFTMLELVELTYIAMDARYAH